MSACMSAEPVHAVRTRRAAAATVTVCAAQFSVIYGSIPLMENYVQCKEVAGSHCELCCCTGCKPDDDADLCLTFCQSSRFVWLLSQQHSQQYKK